MPSKPKKPCMHPGCPLLVEAGERYCEEHKREHNREYDVNVRYPRAKGRYGSQWRKIRARYLSMHPFCENCRKDGRYEKATDVHHVLPLSEGGTHADENLMALCHSCHSRITITATNDRLR